MVKTLRFHAGGTEPTHPTGDLRSRMPATYCGQTIKQVNKGGHLPIIHNRKREKEKKNNTWGKMHK